MAQPQKDRALKALETMVSGLREEGQTLLPPESDLIENLKVGRNTLRTAVSELVNQGILRKIQGKGTFITEKETSLIFSNWADSEFDKISMIDRFANSYKESHPGVNIQNESIPYTLYVNKIMQHFLHNEPADIIQVTPFWLQRFRHLDALLPLTEFAGSQFYGTHYSQAMDLSFIDNGIYAMDWSLCPQILYYNKTVLKAAGIKENQLPKTMEDLERISIQVMENSPAGTYGMCLPMDSYAYNYLQLYPFLLAFGGGFCDSIGNIIIDSPENIEALNWLSKVYRKSGAVNDRQISDGRMLFASNRVAFLIDGPYCRGHLRKLSGKGKKFDDEYGILTIPSGPKSNGTSILLTHSLAISNKCKHPEEAFKWIQYLCDNEENSREYFDEFGMIPSSRDFLKEPYYQEDPFASVLIKQLENVDNSPIKHPLFIKSLPFLLQVMPKIIIEGKSAEKELEFLREVINMIGQDKTMIYL